MTSGLFGALPGRIGSDEAFELVLEARHASAAVHQIGLAGPCRVGFRVDIQLQGIAFLAIGRARFVFGAVRHHDRDEVVIWVAFAFHRSKSVVER